RQAKGNPFLACDIIAGFPGEGPEDFRLTAELCRELDFAWIHAFPYSARPGTRAATFPGRLPPAELADRMRFLGALALDGRKRYAAAWIGRELSAVVEDSATAGIRAVSENYLKLLVGCPKGIPDPGTEIRCVPTAVCPDADGEKPDLLAERSFAV
ncbi:MAG: tRNA (N(6)-L-threonylcarbamoyladenosine(37)-C(2))-methylthiotransferase MtaB, partial [Treponema sp.]|nr:tRNA (N(6)-L-threonylcarbamoyladenosine(37)-C(2))-methylthiotransferase MtaB [Treponema sp.]